MNERELTEKLRRDLLDSGYPEEAIRFEYAAPFGDGKYTYIDAAIIDTKSGDVIAIYELKCSSGRSLLRKATQQVASLSNLFPNKPQCFVYVSDNNGVTLGLVNPKSLTVTFLEKLPSFESIKNTNIAQGRIEKKQESKRAIDTFVVTCYALATLVVVILVLDVFKVYSFSSQQLSLIAIFGALLVIPHAAKIKVVGLEFERHQKPNDKNT
ncbi:TPA: hypothetical protein ACMDT2_004330 [Vibrio parahaemolyticus]